MFKVLVLEDNDDDIFLFRRALKKISHDLSNVEFHYEEDGSAGLKWISHHSPDLIITDNEMLPMDGVRFVKALRDDTSYKDIPIAMMTGHITQPDIKKIENDLVDVFDKNKFEELVPWVDSLLANYLH